ncbi:tetratricopeptide repeat protein [Steroidobacter sp. S1-65]|uniref:Tetratricopeptide repeat protein n=1 Tax=Steroidobacter gossypii TaxID=2805490 RepID=A0ABS1WRJ5_9GAMM|nr:tetratricopeptide repeat protein [Steroidobacter gossypii]MBM0103597.1 tetratricopeptide repeat protein [Steroidobacter gossypii]
MRILIADDEVAQSKTLRPLFAAGGKRKTKVRASAGAPAIGQLIVARAARSSAPKKGKRRAGAAQPGADNLDLGDQPEQAATILDALGISLLNRGMLEEGARLIELALQIRRKFFGSDHPATALSLNSYSRVERERGNYESATAAVQDALRINRKVYGERGLPVAVSLNELGVVQLLQGRFTEAMSSASAGLEILKQAGLYETDPNTTRLLDIVGRAQCALRQSNEAEQTYKDLLALDQKQLGTRKHPKYATHLANFGLVLEQQGKRGGAARAYSNAIDLYANTLNRERHPNLIDAYANLGSLLRTVPSKSKDAGKYLQKALELDVTVRGEGHALVGNDYANLARWQYDTGDRASASRGFSQAMTIYSRNVRNGSLPANHFFIAEALTWQGRLAVELGTVAGGKQGEPLLRQALEIWPAQLGPDTLGEAMAKAYLGRALALQGGDRDDACNLLCEGYLQLKQDPQAKPDLLRQLRSWLKEQGCTCEETPVATAA